MKIKVLAYFMWTYNIDQKGIIFLVGGSEQMFFILKTH